MALGPATDNDEMKTLTARLNEIRADMAAILWLLGVSRPQPVHQRGAEPSGLPGH